MASSDHTGVIKLWDAWTSVERRAIFRKEHGVQTLVFTPDGRTLASSDTSGGVRLWDTVTGQQLHAFPGGRKHLILTAGSIATVAISPDNRLLAHISDQDAVRRL